MQATRRPVVAGRFYPAHEKQLRRQIDGMLALAEPFDANPVAAVCPHAGIVYSGPTAGRLVGALSPLPDTIVVLGPNHTGLGAPVAIDTHDQWETPLGAVPVHTALRDALLDNHGDLFTADARAHQREHSIEVILPFLQCQGQNFRFLPICLGFGDYERTVAIADALFYTLNQVANGRFLVLASSDMSHFHPEPEARKLDHTALAPLLRMDPRETWETVLFDDISMCGVIPAVTALSTALSAGAHTARLIHYTTSADASGDGSSVVGYASLGFFA